MTVYIVCGVAGSGKSTIAKLLADRLGLNHFDADDFHPKSNIDKMSRGDPLDDEDRSPWLYTLADKIRIWSQEGGAVLSCSALKEKYRAVLGSNCSDIIWIFLAGSQELIRQRLEDRKGHFFDNTLLDAQFRDLEFPEYALQVSIENTPEDIINIIIKELQHG